MRYCWLVCAWVVAIGAFAVAAEVAQDEIKETRSMVDPAIDEDGAPFGYLSKPNNEMAMMGARNGFQLTYEGAIYNRENELVLFVGASPMKPMMARSKTVLHGYIPIFSYGETVDGVRYGVETFAWNMTGNAADLPVAFVRVTATNTADAPRKAALAAGFRANGEYRRFAYKSESFHTGWMYEMTANRVLRNDQVLALVAQGDAQEAVPGVAYPGRAFNGDDYQISQRAEYALTHYTPELKAGASRSYDFKMPYRSIYRFSKGELAALEAANFDNMRTACAEFWRKEIAKGMQVHLPEAKADEAWRANLVYDMMAIWTHEDGTWVPGVNKFQYNWFWLRDGGYIARCYDLWGHTETAQRCLDYFPRFQKEDGNFMSQEHQTDGFGQALFALGHHAMLNGDKEYAAKIYKHFAPAVDWLKKTRAADSLGLLPATAAGDNELIKGHYTGHNFWGLSGVRMAQRLALMLDKPEDAARFKREYDDYATSFTAALETVAGKDGYIPPGLDAEGGEDWGNFLGVYPSEVLDPYDPRIAASLKKVRKDKYQEGVMTYLGHIHQYVTVKVTQNFLARGEQEEVLKDYYGILLHLGSANETFEWKAEVYGDRDAKANYGPHGWGSAMFNTLLRNMLVREAGGKAGLAPREIHVFSVLSPEWVKPGQHVSIDRAPTEHGIVSARAEFGMDGGEYTIKADWRTAPETVVIAVPYFVDLVSCDTDAKTVRRHGSRLFFSPDVTRVSLKWTRKVGPEPYSFNKTVADYRAEYARRYTEYIAAGNTPDTVAPPPILTPEERVRRFEEAKKDETK